MNNFHKTVLILGARGNLGGAAVTAFAQSGWRVLAQTRKGGGCWPDVVEEVVCDAFDTAALLEAAEGAVVVVNGLNPLYTEWATGALPLAEQGIEVASKLGALLLYPGNVYNFGPELSEILEESTPFSSDTANTSKGRIRIAIEDKMAAAAQQGLDSAVIRAGDFFGGAKGGGWFDVMVKGLAKGRAVYPGPLDRMHAWSYLPDLARVFVKVANKREALKGFHRLHFGGHPMTGGQWFDAMEAATGRPLKRGGIPWWLLRLVAPFSPMLRALREMRYLWNRPHRLEGKRLEALIGQVPHTPTEQALRMALLDRGLAQEGTSP